MSRIFVRLVPLLVLLVALLPQEGRLAAQDDRFTLAVLRRDGLVIPFASYDNGRWRNEWPVPGKNVEIPLQLSAVPDDWWMKKAPIDTWAAWPVKGTRTEIKSLAPATAIAHCQLAIGIRTSYRPAEAPPPESEQPYPKDGLATSGEVVVEPPVLLEPSAAEWKAVEGDVQRKVTQLENQVLVHREQNWLRTIPGSERAKTPFTAEVVMRVTPGAFYFEGVKSYPPRESMEMGPIGLTRNRCELFTYAAGWVMVSGGGKPKVQASADLTDCDREGMLYSLPLGVIRRPDRVFWIVQVSGWGYERYEVMEVQGDRVKSVLAAAGGWCG